MERLVAGVHHCPEGEALSLAEPVDHRTAQFLVGLLVLAETVTLDDEILLLGDVGHRAVVLRAEGVRADELATREVTPAQFSEGPPPSGAGHERLPAPDGVALLKHMRQKISGLG